MNEDAFERIYTTAHDARVPISLSIELLTKCNEHCLHCYIPEHLSDGLSTQQVKNILHQFRELGGLNVTITGGEIFLRKDLMEIIQEARRLYLRVFLLTNASLITDSIAAKLRELNIAEISVSVYSMNPSEHDQITCQEGSLSKTLAGIASAKKYQIPVIVKTPLMEINKYAYREVRKYCIKNGFNFATSAVIFSKSNGDPSPKKLCISNADLPSILRDIAPFQPIKNFDTFQEACGRLRYMLSVDASGNIYPCNSFYYKIGNIKNMTLSDAWNDSRLISIQNIRKDELEECTQCSLVKKCHRCPGLAYLEDGDIYKCSSTAKCLALLE